MKHKVSVIIPTYGRADSLPASIESVLYQTYKDVEIIVVDDNGMGTDAQQHTELAISKYSDKIIYIPHEWNKGGSYARNTGADTASGDYLCFLDDDDLFHKDKILKQVLLLDANENMVACFCDHIRNNIITNQTTEYHSTYSGNILLPVLLFKVDACSGSTLMVRKDIFQKLNGFTTTLRRRQDYEFLARLSAEGEVGVVSEPMVTIVTHNGSYQQRKFRDIEKTQHDYMEVIEPLFVKLTPKEVDDVLFANNSALLVEAIKKKNLSGVIRYFFKCGLNLKTFKFILSKITTVPFKLTHTE